MWRHNHGFVRYGLELMLRRWAHMARALSYSAKACTLQTSCGRVAGVQCCLSESSGKEPLAHCRQLLLCKESKLIVNVLV
jgi:hypothetical protein